MFRARIEDPATAVTVRGNDQLVKGADVDDYNARALRRLMAKVDQDPSGHWIWQGGVRGTVRQEKYGTIYFHRCKQDAHRVAYQLFIGPIPEGYEVDHVCRVTLCINPEHLEAVTRKVNNDRRVLGKRTPAQDACPSCSTGQLCSIYEHSEARLEAKKLANRRWRERNPGRKP